MRIASRAKDGTIHARVDQKLKDKAEKVLRRVGVTTTDLISMTLHQVVLRDGVPFDVRVPNAETRLALAQLRAGKGETFDGPTSDVFDRITGGRRKRRS